VPARHYLMNQPAVPDIDEFTRMVNEVFGRMWLTNFGAAHDEFETCLEDYLGCEHVLPVTNATIGLYAVLRTLGVEGEVITTPFTFPATYHVLMNIPDVTPVFVDVSRETFCITPEAVCAAITPRTSAIMPVHAYGFPCDVEGMRRVADENGLVLVYDAAPCIGVKRDGVHIVNAGDASVLSFHATKGLSTAEGGAIVCRTKELYERCRLFINFGIRNEDEVTLPGLNAKLDEIRSVLGILALRDVEDGIARRRAVVEHYLDFFDANSVEGIHAPRDIFNDPGTSHNYSYFPLVIEPREGFDRDVLYAGLRERGIVARKYYYPTVLDLDLYKGMDIRIMETKTAASLSRNVVCLPVNQHFSKEDADYVINCLASILGKTSTAGMRGTR